MFLVFSTWLVAALYNMQKPRSAGGSLFLGRVGVGVEIFLQMCGLKDYIALRDILSIVCKFQAAFSSL